MKPRVLMVSDCTIPGHPVEREATQEEIDLLRMDAEWEARDLPPLGKLDNEHESEERA